MDSGGRQIRSYSFYWQCLVHLPGHIFYASSLSTRAAGALQSVPDRPAAPVERQRGTGDVYQLAEGVYLPTTSV